MKHEKVVLDSSIWIELLREGPLVRKCAALLDGAAQVFILGHAQHAGAILVTLDNDFAGLPAAEVLRS